MANASQRVAVIKECLEYKDPIGVKKLILEEEFKDDSYFYELITLLGGCISGENLEQCQAFFEVCERCMIYIVEVGNASELLLSLLEQADSFDDIIKFQTFLQIIQKALLRIESRQQFSLELSLETLSDCIRNLELPKGLDQDGEERRAQDLDPAVDKINIFITAYLEFLKPFVQQVASGKKAEFKGDNFQRQVDCLVKFLLHVLDHPLVFLDLTANTEEGPQRIKSESRLCVESLLQLLLTLYPRFDDLVQNLVKHNERVRRLERIRKRKGAKGDVANGMEMAAALEPMPMLGISCLVYLIHSELLFAVNQIDHTAQSKDLQLNPTAVMYPCLYTPQFIMERNLSFVLALLQQKESEIQRKGVLLFQTLMHMQTEITQISNYDLEKPEYYKILDAMFNIMIHCSVKEIRQNCLKLLPVFIAMCTLDARYRIFTKLFATLKHPGAYGFCIQLFKNQLEEILSSDDRVATQSSQFCNVGLNRIFNLITSLSDGAATDFVENSDRIISVLNFCRYIVLRDPPNVNRTGFWNFHEKMEKDFLDQLHTGLEMAKGHYKLELSGLTEGKQSDKQEVEMSVCVAGLKLPKMELGQKKKILKLALNTLDLVTSLLARLNELIDQQKRLAKA